MINTFCQVMIFLCGASAIWLVGRTESWSRWGYILGALGQPFWFYITLANEQYGIFLLCLFYAYSWCQGIWNHWAKPWRKRKMALDNDMAKLYLQDQYKQKS